MLDNELSFECQINKVVKGCYATIKQLSQIKGFLTSEQLNQLVASDKLIIVMHYTMASMQT